MPVTRDGKKPRRLEKLLKLTPRPDNVKRFSRTKPNAFFLFAVGAEGINCYLPRDGRAKLENWNFQGVAEAKFDETTPITRHQDGQRSATTFQPRGFLSFSTYNCVCLLRTNPANPKHGCIDTLGRRSHFSSGTHVFYPNIDVPVEQRFSKVCGPHGNSNEFHLRLQYFFVGPRES